jgi:hypothetical protein
MPSPSPAVPFCSRTLVRLLLHLAAQEPEILDASWFEDEGGRRTGGAAREKLRQDAATRVLREAALRGGGKPGTERVLIDPKLPAFSHEASERGR